MRLEDYHSKITQKSSKPLYVNYCNFFYLASLLGIHIFERRNGSFQPSKYKIFILLCLLCLCLFCLSYLFIYLFKLSVMSAIIPYGSACFYSIFIFFFIISNKNEIQVYLNQVLYLPLKVNWNVKIIPFTMTAYTIVLVITFTLLFDTYMVPLSVGILTIGFLPNIMDLYVMGFVRALSESLVHLVEFVKVNKFSDLEDVMYLCSRWLRIYDLVKSHNEVSFDHLY